MAWRCDTQDLPSVQRTPAGGLKVEAVVARSTVLEYPWGREYVPPSVMQASLGQLAGLPVTSRHPTSKRVDSRNWSRVAVGHAGEDPRIDDDAQVVTVYIQRADAVGDVETRKLTQLSMGYDVDIDPTPGTAPDGRRYDSVQTARTYNHIALVGIARGGSTLALRLDEAGDAVIDEPAGAGRSNTMKSKVRIDGVDYEVESVDSYFQALDQAEARRAEEARALKARADSAEGERDTLRSQLAEEKARADAASDPARIDERVKARAELESRARVVLGAKAELAGKTDREVMEAVVRSDEKEDLSGRSDDYLFGAFEARTAVPAKPRNDSLDRVRRNLRVVGGDSRDDINPLDRLRLDEMALVSDAWKGGR